MSDQRALVSRLVALRSGLDGVDFSLGLPETIDADQTRTELASQINDYLIPRLKRLDAPLLTVLGGSTGSGKSTITNTIAGADVSPSGVLRPTTRAPVLICHPDDQSWFASDDLLPDLVRHTGADPTASDPVKGSAGGASPHRSLRIVPVPTLLPGLALIDAPDIDSVEEANRELATQLLAAADLWLFVTTAVRYADAVPWEFLERARDRGTSLAVIINRVPEGAGSEIVPHLEGMLTEAGFAELPVFDIEQGDLVEGRLPAAAVADLQQLLHGLAADAEGRAHIVRKTLDGALASIEPRARDVVAAAKAQDTAVEELRLQVERTVVATKSEIAQTLASGAVLRGEVLDRWQELIGTNEMMRAIQSRITSIRDRIGGFIRGRSAATSEVQGEITSALERLLADHADRASLAIVTSWRQLPGGRALLDDRGSAHRRTELAKLERASDEYRAALAPEIRAWQDDILDLVRSRGAGKRNVARVMAFGVNGIGVALMIVLFAQTGGITGGEVAVASGTATVSQALLNALFGEQAVRELADEARNKLIERVDRLLDEDANRFRTTLWQTVSTPDRTEHLEEALHVLMQERA